MSFEPRDYLRHILIEADYLLERSARLTPDAFRTDATLQRAFVRSLEIIGEAAKKVPADSREGHPQVEWRAMAPGAVSLLPLRRADRRWLRRGQGRVLRRAARAAVEIGVLSYRFIRRYVDRRCPSGRARDGRRRSGLRPMESRMSSRTRS